MKTVRFSVLVDSAGKPDTHLLFIKPEDDKILQKAIKAKRVVTVFQNTTGNKTDHGEVGFEPGASRQYLIFPKTVGAFDGRKVVGIKYELLESAPIPKSKQAERPRPPEKRRGPKPSPTSTPKLEEQPSQEADVEEEVPAEKVVKFPEPKPPEDEDSEAVEDIKAQVRRAMRELEKGKQVAAFNLLKRIVGE